MAKVKTILREWRYRLASDNGVKEASSLPEIKNWSSVTSFPSVVQAELIAKKLIPDPYIGENERVIQWVGQCDWEYRTSFETPNGQDECVDLVFEGLDTFATVSLNGREILSSDNQFLPARVSVKDLLQEAGEQNELAILFRSAYKKGSELETKFGPRTSMMRDRRRMHIRKAQVRQANACRCYLCLELYGLTVRIVCLGLGLGSDRHDHGSLVTHIYRNSQQPYRQRTYPPEPITRSFDRGN